MRPLSQEGRAAARPRPRMRPTAREKAKDALLCVHLAKRDATSDATPALLCVPPSQEGRAAARLGPLPLARGDHDKAKGQGRTAVRPPL